MSDCLCKFEVRRLGSHPNIQEFVFGVLGYVTFLILFSITENTCVGVHLFVSLGVAGCFVVDCCICSCSVYRIV